MTIDNAFKREVTADVHLLMSLRKRTAVHAAAVLWLLHTLAMHSWETARTKTETKHWRRDVTVVRQDVWMYMYVCMCKTFLRTDAHERRGWPTVFTSDTTVQCVCTMYIHQGTITYAHVLVWCTYTYSCRVHTRTLTRTYTHVVMEIPSIYEY